MIIVIENLLITENQISIMNIIINGGNHVVSFTDSNRRIDNKEYHEKSPEKGVL